MQGNAAGRLSVVPGLIAGCLLGASLPALGSSPKIYRWTDNNGVTHYGDRRPPEAVAERLPPDVSSSGIRKWTDAQGVVHYGERAPEGVASTELPSGLDQRNLVEGLTPEEKRRMRRARAREAEQEKRRRRARRRSAARARAAQRKREKRCQRARESIDHLDDLLRAAHSLRQDIRYNRKRRRMMDRRRRYCR